MLNKIDYNYIELIDEFLKKYGFTLSYTTGSFMNRVYTNVSDFINFSPCFELEISLLDNKFRFCYVIPKTVFTINSGWLSPLYEKEPKYNQFDKMYNKFKDVVMRFNNEQMSLL